MFKQSWISRPWEQDADTPREVNSQIWFIGVLFFESTLDLYGAKIIKICSWQAACHADRSSRLAI